ncbi:MAG: hypothetical protein WC612_01975 [Bdellovibrionales bacterium]|jgi:hypothetical protein
MAMADDSLLLAFCQRLCTQKISKGLRDKKTNGTPAFAGVTEREKRKTKTVIPAKAGIPFSFSIQSHSPFEA